MADIANQVSAGAQALSQGAMQQKVSMDGLVSNITDITEQIQSSRVRCGDASGLVDKATGYAAEADKKMEQLITATTNIDQSSAQSTGTLIGRSLQDVKTGTESTNLAISAVQVINECIRSIKTLMDEIALASVQQSEMVVSVESRIKEVSGVIQANSAAAEESAAVSNELSGQAEPLNRLIGQFRIR